MHIIAYIGVFLSSKLVGCLVISCFYFHTLCCVSDEESDDNFSADVLLPSCLSACNFSEFLLDNVICILFGFYV